MSDADTLRKRLEELERGLLTTGNVPTDVAERTQRWLKSCTLALNSELSHAAKADREPTRSLVGALAATRVRRNAIAQSSDIGWLCATARGAGLLERRAALSRLTSLAPRTRDRSERASIEALLGTRYSSELGHDQMQLAAAFGGSTARDARERLDAAAALGERFAASVRAFMEGADREPLGMLTVNERATLFLHLRMHAAVVTAYVGAEIERGLLRTDPKDLLDLLGALRGAADRRILPHLAHALLDDTRPEVRSAAAAALGRIDDARAPRALRSAWVRATDVVERLVLAEALGLWGDRRGLDAIRAALDENDELLQKLALQALAAIGDPDLAEPGYALARTSKAREVRVAAVRVIGRAADARGLAWLDALGSTLPDSEAKIPEVLLGALGMAREAIVARLEARGEVAPQKYERKAGPLERVLARPPGAPATLAHRVLARWTLVRARIARIFGRTRSAAAAYARAAAIDPTFVSPPLVEARWRLSMNDVAEAVRCYRRLIAIDPAELTRRPRDLSLAVQALLQRADELDQSGKHDIARELHEDLFGLDLTGCAPSLRVEVRRRLDRPLLTSRPSMSGRRAGDGWSTTEQEAT